MTEKRSLPIRILAFLFAGLVILTLPISVFANQMQRAISSPDVLGEVLSDILLSPGGAKDTLVDLKNGVVALLGFLRRIRLIPIFFFGLLMAVIIRSINDLGRWWGIPLISGSIVGLLIVFLMVIFGPAVLERSIASSAVPIVGRELLQNGVRSVFAHILNAAVFQNIISIIFGGLLYGLTRTREKSINVVGPPNTTIEETASVPSPPPVKPFMPDEVRESAEDETPSGIFD